MKKYTIQIILALILIIASVFRLWQIGEVPISPDWDEAAYGYNAYAVLQTGKDEFGKTLPVVLRSFDDYKPALYLYLVIPFVQIMGVTTEAVRLPSAIAGILTVFLTYFLIKKLFKRDDIALLTAFLLAISPWHIQFSRIAFEANVGVLLNMSMVYCFLKGLKNPKLLMLSAFFAALSIYAYQSEKVFTPLLAGILVLVYFKDLIKIKLPYLISAVIVGVIVLAPMVVYLITNEQALTRARETSIFADKTNIMSNAYRLDADTKAGDTIGLIFDNRRVFYLIKIIDGYIAHFSLNWLFITGDNNPRHHAPYMGLLYLVEMPFLFIGLYGLLFLPVARKAKWLVFLWFLAAPIPASITSGVPHAVRTINFLPLFQLFTAIGLLNTFHWLQRLKLSSMLYRVGVLPMVVVFLILAIGNFSYYINQYFVQTNYYTAEDWQYGYKEAIAHIQTVEKQYDSIIVSDVGQLSESYIFFLYYLKFSPEKYQNRSNRENHDFGKFTFRKIDWKHDRLLKKTLFVGMPEDFSEVKDPTKTITNPDGTEAMRIVGLP